jgi:hypothetical protein
VGSKKGFSSANMVATCRLVVPWMRVSAQLDWFRALLNEKPHIFQIIVFTCRPGDYFAATSMVPNGPRNHEDTDNGFNRAIDLGRALGQHRQSVT